MKPMIDQSFWSDPDIESAKSGVKLAALWLITNSQTSLLGICRASIQRFCFETGLPEEALQRALEGLPRSFVRVGTAIFVRNYIRHQFGTGDKLMRNNFFVALKSLFLSVKEQELKCLILTEYPEFNEGLTKGLLSPSKGKVREEKTEGRAERPKKDKGTAEEILAFCLEMQLPNSDAEWFFSKCEGNGWTNNGKPIANWKSTIRSWKAAGYLPSQKDNGNGSRPVKRDLI